MEYRREIDGLRAVAVLPVILFHAGLPWFSGGYVGVDVFFVVSGYLITTILLEGLETETFSFATFYERRARRILPALFVVMLSCIPLALLTMLPSQFKGFSESLIAVSLFASNLYFLSADGYFAQPSEEQPLLHTWSLGVEEQFYIFFPIFLLILWRSGKRVALYAICATSALSLLLTEYVRRDYPSANFYLLPTRAWELGFGGICAFLLKGRPQRVGEWPAGIGLAMIVFSVVAYDDTTPFPSLYALPPVIGTALIVLFGSGETLVGKLLSSRALVGIGLISFSAYLWHQPLFAFARIAGVDRSPGQGVMLYLSLVTLFLAFLTYRYVETPFRRRGASAVIARRKVFLGSAVMAVGFVCFGAFGYMSDKIGMRFGDPSLAIDREASDASKFYGCESDHKDIIPLESACVIGKTGNVVAALVGDSHATMLAEKLDDAAKRIGVGIIVLTYSGCPPAAGLDLPGRDCDEVNRRNIAFIKESGIPYVIMVARWAFWYSEKRFDNGEGGIESGAPTKVFPVDPSISKSGGQEFVLNSYRDTINSYLKAGIHVVLVWNIPEAGWNVPQYLAALYQKNGKISPTDGSTSYGAYQVRANAVHSLFAGIDPDEKAGRLIHIKPADYFCNAELKDRCVTQKDGIPLYFDSNHLSNKGAALLAPAMAKALIGLEQQRRISGGMAASSPPAR